MKLEFLKDVVPDPIMRLYDFDKLQAKKFRDLIEESIILNHEQVDLTNIDFISAINCSLVLRLSKADVGITITDGKNFFCDLTLKEYEKMVSLLEPFGSDILGYQWLYNLDLPIEFLFSANGRW
jgi:hypothetical protein